MKEICKKYGYYVGAGIGALISAWSIFKAATASKDCDDCACCDCEEPCENAEDGTDA